MKTISLKLDQSVFDDTELILQNLKKPRNRYINDAITHYNFLNKRKILEKQIREESLKVRDGSMRVLKEFEKFEFDDETI